MSSDVQSSLKSVDDIPRQITGKGRKLLEEYIQKEINQGAGCNKVTKELCNLMCEMRDAGMSGQRIANQLDVVSTNAVYYHTRGDCTHEKSDKITYSECGWMRVKSRKGAQTKTLSILYDTTVRTVQTHLSGDCSHDDGIEPVDSELRYENYKAKL